MIKAEPGARLGPYGLNTIVHGNCLDIMSEMPDGCVDMVLTDPPWMVSQQITIHRSMNPEKYKYTGKDIKLDFGEWDHFESDEQYLAFTNAWVREAARIVKEKGHLVIFFDQDRSTQLIEIAKAADCHRRQHLYWLKSNPVPRARKVDFMVALEHATWFTKGERSKATFHYELGQQKNYVEAPIVHHARRIHPTQKPVKVLGVWIQYLSNEGDVIFDPFMGSGATAVAAHKFNRDFFGCDISGEYVIGANKWVERTMAQQKLF